MESRKSLTTDSGAPVTDNQNSRTAGPAGPVLVEDHHLISNRVVPLRLAGCEIEGVHGAVDVQTTHSVEDVHPDAVVVAVGGLVQRQVELVAVGNQPRTTA